MNATELSTDKYYIGNFGDKRLLEKGVLLFKMMCEKLTMNIRKLATNRTTEVGMHRFLNNDNVTQEEIEASIAEKTVKNIGNVEDLLIINDTTEVSFPSQKQKKVFFGGTGNEYANGFFMHPNIVIDPNKKTILGMAGVEIWQRTEVNTKKTRSKKPIEKKESYKWIKALQKGQKYCRHVKQKTFVTDRESDIYEYMNLVAKNNDKFIVRSRHNRRIEEADSCIVDHISKTEISHTYECLIEETPKRKKRTARLHVRYGQLTMLRSKSIIEKDKYDEKLIVNFVDVEEDLSTAPDEKQKIHWRLLSNHEVGNIDDAIAVIDRYKLRWIIEPIFGGSKKRGLNIEECQISSFNKLKKLATIAINSVIHVFYLIKVRDGKGNVSAEIMFSDKQLMFLYALLKTLEGKTEKQKNPYRKDSLSWASWIIARLGGWKGYASERPPGYSTMHDGLQKFYNMFQGWEICNA